MYTGSSTDDDKTRLVEAFKSPTGNVRVMVTTVAFGMGVNILDVDIVVHWGAPRSFLGYWQEVAGRSGNPAIALLLPYKRSIIKAMCDEDFAFSLKSQQCVRRRAASRAELPTAAPCDGLCSVCRCCRCQCCSFCHAICECPGQQGQIVFFTAGV